MCVCDDCWRQAGGWVMSKWIKLQTCAAWQVSSMPFCATAVLVVSSVVPITESRRSRHAGNQAHSGCRQGARAPGPFVPCILQYSWPAVAARRPRRLQRARASVLYALRIIHLDRPYKLCVMWLHQLYGPLLRAWRGKPIVPPLPHTVPTPPKSICPATGQLPVGGGAACCWPPTG